MPAFIQEKEFADGIDKPLTVRIGVGMVDTTATNSNFIWDGVCLYDAEQRAFQISADSQDSPCGAEAGWAGNERQSDCCGTGAGGEEEDGEEGRDKGAIGSLSLWY